MCMPLIPTVLYSEGGEIPPLNWYVCRKFSLLFTRVYSCFSLYLVMFQSISIEKASLEGDVHL